MEQSFSDLLSDALSETSVPTFTDGDFDFENFHFDKKFEDDEADIHHESLQTKEDRALYQEGAGETSVLFSMETKDIHMTENVDEEIKVDVHSVSVVRTPEEDYTSSDGDSEQEGSISGGDDDDEAEDMGTGVKPGYLFMSEGCSDEFRYGKKEDRVFAEGHLPAHEGAEKPQVGNKAQGESESDEEVSYFGRVPECGNETVIKRDETEEDEDGGEKDKQEDHNASKGEGMQVKQEEHLSAQGLAQEAESPHRGGPATAGSDFPEISRRNLQDLVVDVNSEGYEEKIKHFSGEEYEGAGESFADSPSDCSSCEYVKHGVKNPERNSRSSPLTHRSGSNAKQNECLDGAVADMSWMGTGEDGDDLGDGYLYVRDLNANKNRSVDLEAVEKDSRETEIECENVFADATVSDDAEETGETDSYSSSDDELQVRRGDEELLDDMSRQDPADDKKLEATWLHRAAFARWSISNDQSDGVDQADLSPNWDLDVSQTASVLPEDLLTADDAHKAQTLLSDASRRPAEHIVSYSVLQTTRPAYQGSLDDGFLYEPEASAVSELGPLGEDEPDEQRNWDQEKERIKAFYKFYNDSEGENENEERKIKVQFCTDALSQVINYETDRSDTDSLSSSTDRDEDLSSAETSETPACDHPNAQMPEIMPEKHHNTHICSRKQKCFHMLKLILKMGLVIGTGLLMFWLATDQLDWLSHASFFQR